MFHDSEDEEVSSDEKEPLLARKVTRTRDRDDLASNRKVEYKKRKDKHIKTGGVAKYESGRQVRNTYGGFRMYPVIVVDYDLTLVDRTSKPFPGSHEFIAKLREYNDGQSQIILYSHGSPAYIRESLAKNYKNEQKFFDELIADSSARDNKPVTHVRRVIKRLDYLIGPYVIIDDMRPNLDSDQYDICVDVTRMTNYDQRGKALSIDYDACLCTIEQGVQEFLKTKRK